MEHKSEAGFREKLPLSFPFRRKSAWRVGAAGAMSPRFFAAHVPSAGACAAGRPEM
jgi:hypothetical protein